jgi:hypothetical protein
MRSMLFRPRHSLAEYSENERRCLEAAASSSDDLTRRAWLSVAADYREAAERLNETFKTVP